MAINQAQVDHIISAASADDPEVKLQKLQDEVDLIKKSVKKILIDIRERLNDTENPFTVTETQMPGTHASHQKAGEHANGESPPSPVTVQPQVTVAPVSAPPAPVPTIPVQQPVQHLSYPAPGFGEPSHQLKADEEMLRLLQQKLEIPVIRPLKPPAEEKKQDKLRLHKVHRLFEWTRTMVKKYGHDRLEIMVDSYRAMGYVSQEAAVQIKEIARLMPESIGDLHEMGSDEFVTELYELNRILDPQDASLDSDMIEVLLEHRKKPGTPGENKSGKEKGSSSEWIEMLDRV